MRSNARAVEEARQRDAVLSFALQPDERAPNREQTRLRLLAQSPRLRARALSSLIALGAPDPAALPRWTAALARLSGDRLSKFVALCGLIDLLTCAGPFLDAGGTRFLRRFFDAAEIAFAQATARQVARRAGAATAEAGDLLLRRDDVALTRWLEARGRTIHRLTEAKCRRLCLPPSWSSREPGLPAMVFSGSASRIAEAALAFAEAGGGPT